MVLLSSISHAGSTWQGKVLEIRASNVSGAILFRLSGDIKKPASCNDWKMYAIDPGLPGGEQVFELVKFAFLNELDVEARGLGTCRTHWKSEGVKEVSLTSN